MNIIKTAFFTIGIIFLLPLVALIYLGPIVLTACFMAAIFKDFTALTSSAIRVKRRI